MTWEEQKETQLKNIDRIQLEIRERTRFLMLLWGLIIAIGIMVIGGMLAIIKIDTVMREQMAIRQSIERLELPATEEGMFYEEADYFPLTDFERDLVERVVMAEARGESFTGQMAAAQTIRCRSEEWGYSISDVLFADRQFAEPYQGATSASVEMAVDLVFGFGWDVFYEGVTHFHSIDIDPPYWTNDKQLLGIIGKQAFYR